MKKQWEWVYWLYIDQIKKDEETLHVIMSKEGSVVNNKFWTMFICNFRAYSIASRPKMIVVSHYGHPKDVPQKMIKRGFFYGFLNQG